VGVKVLLTADVKPTHTAYALGAPFKQGVRYWLIKTAFYALILQEKPKRPKTWARPWASSAWFSTVERTWTSGSWYVLRLKKRILFHRCPFCPNSKRLSFLSWCGDSLYRLRRFSFIFTSGPMLFCTGNWPSPIRQSFLVWPLFQIFNQSSYL